MCGGCGCRPGLPRSDSDLPHSFPVVPPPVNSVCNEQTPGGTPGPVPVLLHDQTVYAPDHVQAQWLPPDLHSAAMPSQWFWQSVILPVCASDDFDNDLPAVTERLVFCLSSVEKTYCEEFCPDPSDKPSGCHTLLHTGLSLCSVHCEKHKDLK